MTELLAESLFFGFFLSLAAYGVGLMVKKRWKLAIFNPLLVAIVLVIVFLAVTGLDYQVYNDGAKYLSYLLTPATVCLAAPLYEQFALLRRNAKAIMLGIVAGVLASLCCILLLAVVFRLDHAMYVTLLPKSITTAIGMSLSEEMGGYGNLTAAIIIITGVLGNMTAPFLCRIGGITDPIARGIAIGTSAHAIGTAKAMELGETEGAMSSLAIGVAGIITVIVANVFIQFL